MDWVGETPRLNLLIHGIGEAIIGVTGMESCVTHSSPGPQPRRAHECNLVDWSGPCSLLNLVGVAVTPHKYTRPVKVDGVETVVLIDSGALSP